MTILTKVPALTVLLLTACSPSASTSSSAPPDAPLVVTYEVVGQGTSTASLTIATPTGTSQSKADLPVRNKSGSEGLIFHGFSHGAFLYVSAQNDEDSGEVTCRIKVGDAVVSENSASGAYEIATCQAQA